MEVGGSVELDGSGHDTVGRDIHVPVLVLKVCTVSPIFTRHGGTYMRNPKPKHKGYRYWTATSTIDVSDASSVTNDRDLR